MLLDEDPATLIHECTSNFHTTSDRDSLHRIISNLTTLRTSRQERLNTQTFSLKKLTRKLHTLQQQHELDLSHANPTEHASEILRLDGNKFRIAKEASDAEIEGERLDGECRRAEGQLRELESGKGGLGVDGEAEKEVLKLKIYRSLGVEIDGGKEGVYERAVVRDAARGIVEVVDFEEGVAAGAYAEKIWGSL